MPSQECLVCATDEGIFLDVVAHGKGIRNIIENYLSVDLRKNKSTPPKLCHKCTYELTECTKFIDKFNRTHVETKERPRVKTHCGLCAEPGKKGFFYPLRNDKLQDVFTLIQDLFDQDFSLNFKTFSVCLNCRYNLDVLSDLKKVARINSVDDKTSASKINVNVIKRKTTTVVAPKVSDSSDSETGSKMERKIQKATTDRRCDKCESKIDTGVDMYRFHATGQTVCKNCWVKMDPAKLPTGRKRNAALKSTTKLCTVFLKDVLVNPPDDEESLLRHKLRGSVKSEVDNEGNMIYIISDDSEVELPPVPTRPKKGTKRASSENDIKSTKKTKPTEEVTKRQTRATSVLSNASVSTSRVRPKRRHSDTFEVPDVDMKKLRVRVKKLPKESESEEDKSKKKVMKSQPKSTKARKDSETSSDEVVRKSSRISKRMQEKSREKSGSPISSRASSSSRSKRGKAQSQDDEYYPKQPAKFTKSKKSGKKQPAPSESSQEDAEEDEEVSVSVKSTRSMKQEKKKSAPSESSQDDAEEDEEVSISAKSTKSKKHERNKAAPSESLQEDAEENEEISAPAKTPKSKKPEKSESLQENEEVAKTTLNSLGGSKHETFADNDPETDKSTEDAKEQLEATRKSRRISLRKEKSKSPETTHEEEPTRKSRRVRNAQGKRKREGSSSSESSRTNKPTENEEESGADKNKEDTEEEVAIDEGDSHPYSCTVCSTEFETKIEGMTHELTHSKKLGVLLRKVSVTDEAKENEENNQTNDTSMKIAAEASEEPSKSADTSAGAGEAENSHQENKPEDKEFDNDNGKEDEEKEKESEANSTAEKVEDVENSLQTDDQLEKDKNEREKSPESDKPEAQNAEREEVANSEKLEDDENIEVDEKDKTAMLNVSHDSSLGAASAVDADETQVVENELEKPSAGHANEETGEPEDESEPLTSGQDVETTLHKSGDKASEMDDAEERECAEVTEKPGESNEDKQNDDDDDVQEAEKADEVSEETDVTTKPGAASEDDDEESDEEKSPIAEPLSPSPRENLRNGDVERDADEPEVDTESEKPLSNGDKPEKTNGDHKLIDLDESSQRQIATIDAHIDEGSMDAIEKQMETIVGEKNDKNHDDTENIRKSADMPLLDSAAEEIQEVA